MKSAFILLLALVAVMAADLKKPYYDLNKAEQYFEKFIVDYNRHYKDAHDRQIHFEAFKKSLVQINEQNAREPSAVFDINDFADYTEEEMKHLNGFKIPDSKS